MPVYRVTGADFEPSEKTFSRRNLLVWGLKRNHPLKHGTVYSKPWPT